MLGQTRVGCECARLVHRMACSGGLDGLCLDEPWLCIQQVSIPYTYLSLYQGPEGLAVPIGFSQQPDGSHRPPARRILVCKSLSMRRWDWAASASSAMAYRSQSGTILQYSISLGMLSAVRVYVMACLRLCCTYLSRAVGLVGQPAHLISRHLRHATHMLDDVELLPAI